MIYQKNTFKMKNKLVKLEAIRGFAALYVVFHHSVHKLIIFDRDFSFLFRFGQEAVILFFILSGFVIEYSYSKVYDKTFNTYFQKRFLRIYIPLIFVFLANYFIESIEGDVNFDWMVLIGNIFMLQDIPSLKPNVIVPTFLGNSPLWSLSYEWWFYMLYFPVIKIFKINSSLIVYLVGIFSASIYIFLPNFFIRELMYFSIWWSGVDIARLYLKGLEINFYNLKLSIFSMLTITIILFINIIFSKEVSTVGVHPILELRHFGFALFAIILSLIWKKINWKGFSFLFNRFSYFAPISYGFYISHYFLISNATYLNDKISNDFLRYFTYVVVCLAFSYLVERVIFIKINNYVMKR